MGTSPEATLAGRSRSATGRTGDVEDPYGGDYQVYVDCAKEIQGLLLAGWALLTSTGEDWR